MLRRIRDDTATRGAWLAPLMLASYVVYQFFGMPDRAFVNLAGAMAAILFLHAFRVASDEAISAGLLVFLAGIAAATANDWQITRVMLGGLFLIAAISAVAAWRDSREPLDAALAAGVNSEFALWALGNSARGTFGEDVALSAIGQAYGPAAQPLQIVFIFAAYAVAALAVKFRGE